MRGTSVVSTGYGTQTPCYGGMGVVGPTRMDYPGTIAAVAAVARYIGEVSGRTPLTACGTDVPAD